jgi:hypothetical protein
MVVQIDPAFGISPPSGVAVFIFDRYVKVREHYCELHTLVFLVDDLRLAEITRLHARNIDFISQPRNVKRKRPIVPFARQGNGFDC